MLFELEAIRSAKDCTNTCSQHVHISLFTDEELPPGTSDDLGNQFTEIFIKKGDNVGLLLSLLDVSTCVL